MQCKESKRIDDMCSHYIIIPPPLEKENANP